MKKENIVWLVVLILLAFGLFFAFVKNKTEVYLAPLPSPVKEIPKLSCVDRNGNQLDPNECKG